MISSIAISNTHWLVPTLVVISVLAAGMSWANRRAGVEQRVRIACGVLKLGGLGVLGLALMEPIWISERAKPGANYFAVIADNSQSLQIKDGAGNPSRGETLRKLLAEAPDGWQAGLEHTFQLRRYSFDSRLQTLRDFSGLKFDGRSSALGTALQNAVEQWRGQPVAGVLLFTDGNATDIGTELPALEGSPPIYPVVPGADGESTDISLKKVPTSQTAFEDAPVTIQASVAATGFSGQEIVALLTEIATGSGGFGTNQDGLHVSLVTNSSSQQVQKASRSDTEMNFRFEVIPQGPGLHFYELEARERKELEKPNQPTRESTLVNNRQLVVVDRGQEPFRVLYVSGRPTWEYKFLNRAIQEDSQVQMVSLIRIAKREPKFLFKARPGESSNPLFHGFDNKDEDAARYDQPVLIRLGTRDELELRGGFPKTAADLFQYHAVIIGALEAEFFSPAQQALLQQFVSERGGGFLMLGGAESFREGGYAGTPIGSILPVYLDRPTDARLPAPLKLTLTREGWLQPWTRLRSTEDEEKTRLESMPAFEVLNPAQDTKPGAAVLATVSDQAEKTYPALVAQRYGLGRSAALMIGDMWRWGLRDESMQKDLAKSWRQLFRWLVSDVPARIALTTDNTGDPSEVKITVKVRDEEFKPLDNCDVRLTVRLVSPGVQNGTNTAASEYVTLTAEPSARTPGSYDAIYIARQAGAYAVDALVTSSDGKVAGRAATGWTSDPAAAEFRSLKPNRALLESIARKTGGEMVRMEDLPQFVQRLPQHRAPVTETWSQPLWHKPVVFLFVLTCFVAEWGIRRWKGLA